MELEYVLVYSSDAYATSTDVRFYQGTSGVATSKNET